MAGIPDDWFSVRWNGFVMPLATGWYQFRMACTRCDVRLTIGRLGLMLATGDFTSPVFLFKDRPTSIQIDLRAYNWEMGVYLWWTLPNGYTEIVPQVNLYHYAAGFACPCLSTVNAVSQQCNGAGLCVDAGCQCDSTPYRGANCSQLRCREVSFFCECVNYV